MRQRLHQIRSNDDRGFTLIELLITVVILGVLAGVVVFSVANFNNEGVTAACKADVKNVEVAGEAYFAKNGSYAGTVLALQTAGFLKEVPTSTKYSVTYAAGTAAGDLTGGAVSTDCSA